MGISSDYAKNFYKFNFSRLADGSRLAMISDKRYIRSSLNDLKKMNEFFVKESNSEKEDVEVREEIKSIDDGKKSIKVVRVEIKSHEYDIIFMLENAKWALERGMVDEYSSLLFSN